MVIIQGEPEVLGVPVGINGIAQIGRRNERIILKVTVRVEIDPNGHVTEVT